MTGCRSFLESEEKGNISGAGRERDLKVQVRLKLL